MNNVLEIIVSFFANFFDNEPIDRALKDVVSLAMSESIKKLTLEIRRLRGIANNSNTPIDQAIEAKNKADKLKKQLPSFLTDVYCKHGKKRSDIINFVPFVGFDVDHIEEEETEALMELLKADPYVCIAEPSCSRMGVHFMIMTDAADWLNLKWDGKNIKPYEFVWTQAKEYVEGAFGIEIDTKCMNPEHIFGICYDELIHYKENPVALHIDTTKYVEPAAKVVTPYSANAVSGTYQASIYDVSDKIISRIEQSGIYFTVGSRNDFVLRFALAANKYGVSQYETESFCTTNFAQSDFKDNEILATIRSAYSKTAEHGTFCATCADAQQYANKAKEDNYLLLNSSITDEQQCANAQTAQKSDDEELNLSFQHTFSDKIPEGYWCEYFKPVLGSMDDAEGKDKMILGTININSGMIPNYYGIYGGHTIYPPLYFIYYGPSASRKGEIGCCLYIAKPLKNEVIGQYHQDYDIFRTNHAIWESKGTKAADKAERGEEPKEPEYRSPIIPANSSASATYQALNANGGWGIMFETEASTLTHSLLSDYGDYSDGLLKAFHHESIPMNRIKDKLHIDIENPRLAVGLTCTPGQLPKLFPTFEDGLGNRFLYYGLNRKLAWINPFKKIDKPLNEVYEDLGKESLNLYHMMMDLGNRRIQFLLTDEQIEQFNTFFSDLLMEQFAMLGDGISAFIFRLGISTFRIAMTLTMLRRYSDREEDKPLFADNEQAILCSDKDFYIAMTIMNTLVNHTATIYSALAKDDEGLGNKHLQDLSAPERTLYDALGVEFDTNSINEAADRLHMNQATVRRYVGNYVNKYHIAERIKNGLYRKIKKQFCNGK